MRYTVATNTSHIKNVQSIVITSHVGYNQWTVILSIDVIINDVIAMW